ncbi:MAG: hypothetical protein WC635_10425 [Bacteriovorax sp.]|jgi:predicted  nucleic acid-binding Zn-ribbon protein
MEILMVLTLTVMGIYFFKSTDLPKDLKERSAQFRSETSTNETSKNLKFTFPKDATRAPVIDSKIDAKLAEMKLQKKIKEIEILNSEIDKLTLEITSLEQEIKTNNSRNTEIQKTIDSHLISLQLLQEKITLLS